MSPQVPGWDGLSSARAITSAVEVDQVGADLPEPGRNGLVVAAVSGPLLLVVCEVPAGHLLKVGGGRDVDGGSSAVGGAFHEVIHPGVCGG